MKYRFITDHRSHYSVKKMCRLLNASRSGYYAWSKRKGGHYQYDRELALIIKELFKKSRQTYGSVRLSHAIRDLGHKVSRRRVSRLMRDLRLKPKAVRRYKVTTRSNEQHEKADNLVAQQFDRTALNEVWCSDITFIRTREGWLYLTTVMDLCSRKIVGWSASQRMTTETTTLSALQQAWQRQCPKAGLIFHSDRGSQYTCKVFQDQLKVFKMVPSMSGRGNCYDNAVAESFFHTLKVELMTDRIFRTRKEARLAIFDYIEIFYNRQRKHSTLDYLSPNDFEEKMKELKNVS